MKVFEQEYSDESFAQDIERDIYEAMLPEYNPKVKDIPVDEHGFRKGSFKVEVTYIPEETT